MPDTAAAATDEHPCSVAFRSGDLVAESGRLGFSEPGVLVPVGFEAECPQAFANFDEALRSAGAARTDMVKVVYPTDIADRVRLNAVYRKSFAWPRPARSCAGVAAPAYGGCVEIDAVARTRTDRGSARAA
ncbi:Rid family hydrolase [Streptomyces sp. 549]|uniref:Rid family hydrolase n=1 Tax=Streptomyces sp. 549 TaxID=3049076 RepID=UPI0024C23F40|nr:Rid family hydrolase [Streptomyces sp. 549]MDK1475871.1 Rid family hydrolase [Streptomyces sp. 549]